MTRDTEKKVEVLTKSYTLNKQISDLIAYLSKTPIEKGVLGNYKCGEDMLTRDTVIMKKLQQIKEGTQHLTDSYFELMNTND